MLPTARKPSIINIISQDAGGSNGNSLFSMSPTNEGLTGLPASEKAGKQDSTPLPSSTATYEPEKLFVVLNPAWGLRQKGQLHKASLQQLKTLKPMD